MSQQSAIEWTEATWNPVTGCDRISPGCDHCYAMSLAARLKRMGQPGYQRDGDPRTSGPGFGVTLHPDRLMQPARWRRGRVVFVNSMSDLFHKAVPFPYIAAVFGVMAATPQHTYQVLTKRPRRMRQFFTWHRAQVAERDLRWEPWRVCKDAAYEICPDLPAAAALSQWPLPNVWLGTSVELNTYAQRVQHLLASPAAVRFVSAEPLLGPLDQVPLDDLDWLIVGGESGRGARPVDQEWIRELRDRSTASGVAFFFKQWGGRTPKSGGRELDGRTWDEMPARRT